MYVCTLPFVILTQTVDAKGYLPLEDFRASGSVAAFRALHAEYLSLPGDYAVKSIHPPDSRKHRPIKTDCSDPFNPFL